MKVAQHLETEPLPVANGEKESVEHIELVSPSGHEAGGETARPKM
jgi:hypothetical protein